MNDYAPEIEPVIWSGHLLYEVLKSAEYELVPDMADIDMRSRLPLVIYSVGPGQSLSNGPVGLGMVAPVDFTVCGNTTDEAMMTASAVLKAVQASDTRLTEYGWVSSASPTTLPWPAPGNVPGAVVKFHFSVEFVLRRG